MELSVSLIWIVTSKSAGGAGLREMSFEILRALLMHGISSSIRGWGTLDGVLLAAKSASS